MRVLIVLLVLTSIVAHRHHGDGPKKDDQQQLDTQCRRCVANADGVYQWCPHTPTTQNDYDGKCISADESCPTTLEFPIYAPSECAGDAPELKTSCSLCLGDGYTWCSDDENDDMSGSCVAIDSFDNHEKHASSTGADFPGRHHGGPPTGPPNGGWPGHDKHEGEGDAEGKQGGHRGRPGDGGRSGHRGDHRPHGLEDVPPVPVLEPAPVDPTVPAPTPILTPAPGDEDGENESNESESENGEGRSDHSQRSGDEFPDRPDRPEHGWGPRGPDGDHKDNKDGWRHHRRPPNRGDPVNTGEPRTERPDGEGRSEREGHHGDGRRSWWRWGSTGVHSDTGSWRDDGNYRHHRHHGDRDEHHGGRGRPPFPPQPPQPPMGELPVDIPVDPVVIPNPGGDSTGVAVNPVVPPNVNTGLAPPNVNTGLAPPNVNTGLVPPNVNTGLAPTNVNTGLAPPNVNTGLIPRHGRPPWVRGSTGGHHGGDRAVCSKRSQQLVQSYSQCPAVMRRSIGIARPYGGGGGGHHHWSWRSIVLMVVVPIILTTCCIVCCIRRRRKRQQLIKASQCCSGSCSSNSNAIDNNNSNCNNNNNNGVVVNLPAVTTINVSRPVYATSPRATLRQPLIQGSEELPSEDMGAEEQQLQQSRQEHEAELVAHMLGASVQSEDAGACAAEGQLPTELGASDEDGRPMPSEAVLMLDDAIISTQEMEGEIPENQPTRKGFFARLLGKKPTGYQPVQ